ncbi:endonuclease/exonuclease/phosphatase family protein [Photobacterium sp. GB-50]|uniref:endonuclease/exonuclease/phosphatase family protein n=1 Tax=Photobacterium sp. GB-50 TaxID=2022107 RepID=UPI000D158ED1|nr:endonuclease/exonuclease/phosphatase family protein [Photobacterium sp. GB-50]PSW74901.1 endonuclease/exonuclease/phosphatase family protein [Photobacterium sp. GB-50]
MAEFLPTVLETKQSLRVAMFNVAMSEPEQGRIFQQTSGLTNKRFQRLAAIIQHVNADVLLLCEFDHPGNGGDDGSLDNFCQHYLSHSQYQQSAIDYPYRYCPSSNTGLITEIDLNGDGLCTLPEDAQGYGEFHGHFGFVILSKCPLQQENIRTWQHFLWKDMPNNLMPVDYYSKEAQQILRLSSKNHVVVPIVVEDKEINLLCCHPTPPVFDGNERRNAKRNHDEIQLLIDIINDESYLVDDNDQVGGLKPDDAFIVMGDLNADLDDGDGFKDAIKHLLKLDKINTRVSSGKQTPKSEGARHYYPWQKRTGRKNEWTHLAGLRLDYVLPSRNLDVIKTGVFWPDKHDLLRELILDCKGREKPSAGSDHRMVWVDINIAD